MSSVAEDRTAAILDELTRKQRLYCEGILAGKSKYASAIAAGYSQESARNAGYVIEREPVREALEQIAALAEETTEQAPEGALEAQEETMEAEAVTEVRTDAEQALEERRRYVAQHGLAASFQQWGNRTAWAVVRTGPATGAPPIGGPFETEQQALSRAEAIIAQRQRSQTEEAEREEKQRKDRMAEQVRWELEKRRRNAEHCWKASGLPDQLRGKGLDDFQPKNEAQKAALTVARAWLSDRADRTIYGGGLLLVGLSLRDLAQLLVAQLVREGSEVRGVSLPRLIAAMHRDGVAQGLGAELVTAPLLYLDAITVREDEEVSEMLDACLDELAPVLEARLDANRPTVMLVTCTPRRLEQALDKDGTNTLGPRVTRRNRVIED